MATEKIENSSQQLDERTTQDFLIYANAVIKSRAIPLAEDGLKPVHRRILYSMYESKYFHDKPFVKSAKVVGNVMGALHPHGDSSIYGALVRLAQKWRLRYPVIEGHGNFGNILGDGAAAHRYTECRLSPIGELMVQELNQNCVDFTPNFDGTTEEPIFLPSKFPFLLCENSSGIAVGMGSDLVSHNFTETAAAIQYYLDNKETCTVSDLMNFIKGPDFPTGAKVLNGEELLSIYTKGQGSIKVEAHYDISKKGNKTVLTFHDLPYGVEYESGVKEPLKKLMIDEGYDVFESVNFEGNSEDDTSFNIIVTLAKNADVRKCLDILFSKTRLRTSIKVNQILIVNGEPKTLSLLDMIKYWVDFRSDIIKKIAQNDYKKTNHKLTVTIGLQKCLSDIDLLVNLIRNSASRAAAKSAIMQAFELNEEQADAVLDMKLSRLSKLEINELNEEEKNLEKQLAAAKNIIDNESKRYDIIKSDLASIKKIIGVNDKRLTEITYSEMPTGLNEGSGVSEGSMAIKKEFRIYPEGLRTAVLDGVDSISSDLCGIVFAYSPKTIYVYNKSGSISPVEKKSFNNAIGGFVRESGASGRVVSVTKNGNVKVSLASEYRWTKEEKVMKIKDDDELVFVGLCGDSDVNNAYLLLFDETAEKVLKLAIKDLNVAGKSTVGLKSGLTNISSAMIVAKDSDLILMSTADGKGKFTSVKDFSTDSRGNKGQSVPEGTKWFLYFNEQLRETVYIVPKVGKAFEIKRDKLSIKGKSAIGAQITSRAIKNII